MRENMVLEHELVIATKPIIAYQLLGLKLLSHTFHHIISKP